MKSAGELGTRVFREKGGGWLPEQIGWGVVRDYGIVVSFLVLFVTLASASHAFLTKTNLLNILDQNAAVGLIACGGTLVIIGGGFDLSVGAIFAIAGVVAAKAAPTTGPEVALVAGALTGLGFGICNGVITTIGRVNPFIATLSTMIIIRGLALALTGGFLITVSDNVFTELGRSSVGTVKYSAIVWACFAVLCAVLLRRTVVGRYIFAAGGNAEAARLSGIRVGLVRASTFAVSGLSAGIAGVVVASRVGAGQADSGAGLELTAIAAIVIGGTSIFGGEGAIWRTMLGVLLLAMIGNGFNLLGVSTVYQEVFQGAIILTAVGIDAWARRGRA